MNNEKIVTSSLPIASYVVYMTSGNINDVKFSFDEKKPSFTYYEFVGTGEQREALEMYRDAKEHNKCLYADILEYNRLMKELKNLSKQSKRDR